MAIIAPVVDGKLEYEYTDSSKKEVASGSQLGYDQFLQLLCAEMQYQDPLEPTTNTDYVAQMATFSQLEATLSLANTQQSTMASSLVGQQVILKVTNDAGVTKYIEGRVDYTMYEDGEIYLSVNDGLYPLDTLDTVADIDYYEAVSVAKTLKDMLGQLPNMIELTTGYETAVQQIRDLYDGMTEYQKKYVSSDELKKLVSYEERIKELKGAQDTEDSSSSDSADSTGSAGASGSEAAQNA